MIKRVFITTIIMMLSVIGAFNAAFSGDLTFEVKSNLNAGITKVDITPPIGMPLRGYSERTAGSIGIRDPLRAAVLVLDDGSTKAAIIGLDVIGISYDGTAAMRNAVAEKTGVPEENILIGASHTHASPGFNHDTDWGQQIIKKVAGAAWLAMQEMRPVSIGYGENMISFNVNRRLIVEGESQMQPNPGGPNDTRVKVLRFDDGSSLTPMAILMHAVCHSNVFRMNNLHVSGDFPGEAQHFIERVYGYKTKTLFLQGCCGDIRANLPGIPGVLPYPQFRSGNEADMQWAGMDLGCAVVSTSGRLIVHEELLKRPSEYKIKCASESLSLPGKQDKTVRFDIQALRIGDFMFIALPGEPFVEYGLNIEKVVGDRAKTFVVGYANGSVGYICTEESYNYKGYEPNASRLESNAEKIILKEAALLIDKMLK